MRADRMMVVRAPAAIAPITHSARGSGGSDTPNTTSPTGVIFWNTRMTSAPSSSNSRTSLAIVY
jgi:hypothetical protein